MGYKLPDGRYVDDQGKTWKNYNDAAAAATTRQRRAETEAGLSRQRQYQLNAANKLEQGQLGKRFFGWMPGVGALQDRRMEEDARAKAGTDLAVNALQKQLAIHKGQMGEAPMPGAVPPGVEPKADPPAPGLGAPDAYGDPAERAREAEQRRMMQQYASKEYWDTEQGKAMLALGNQDRYSGQDLGGFYEAQGAVGIGSFDEVIGGLAQLDDRYKDGGDLRKWAEANKTLALREYMKRVPQGQAPDPSQGDIRTAMEQGKFYAPENSPNPLAERSQLVSGVDPGITLGPPPGSQAQANRSQMERIQAIIPQTAATETGDKTFNMQHASAIALGYQPPAEPLAAGNIPPSSLSPEGISLREQYKRMIQNGANGFSNYGGRGLT